MVSYRWHLRLKLTTRTGNTLLNAKKNHFLRSFFLLLLKEEGQYLAVVLGKTVTKFSIVKTESIM